MTMNAPTSPLRTPSAIDTRKVGAFQAALFLLCLVTLVIDGLDLQLLSFAAPPILAEWGITKAAFGPAMAAALVGMAIGNGAGGWLADRYGRRPVLIASVLLFGLGTLATACAPDLATLIALRALCGLGFGAAVPSIMSLVVEWVPERLQGPAIGLLAVSTPLGGLAGAVFAGWLIGEWGWRACFIASGAATILLAVALLLKIPESPAYLFQRGRGEKAKALLVRALGPLSDAEVEAIVARGEDRPGDESPNAPRAGGVFARENVRLNIGFSLSLFANSFAGYGFISWTPVILSGAGMELADAIRGSFFFNLFAIIGAFGGASAMSRLGSRQTMIGSVLLTLAAVAALILLLPGYRDTPSAQAAVMAALCLAGFGVGGLQGCNYALSAISYPAAYRSSGIGLVAAAGRVGGIVAVIAGGLLLSLETGIFVAFFGAMAMMLLIALAGILTVDRHLSSPRRAAD